MTNQSQHILFTTGEEDFWGRLIYKNKNNVQFVEVDGVPHHITKDYGEPISPLKNYIILDVFTDKNPIKTADLFARKCSFTNKGMNVGFIFNNGDFYCKSKSKAKEECLKNGYANLDAAYKDEFYFYTSWKEDDLEQEGIAYDKNGIEHYYIKDRWYKRIS